MRIGHHSNNLSSKQLLSFVSSLGITLIHRTPIFEHLMGSTPGPAIQKRKEK